MEMIILRRDTEDKILEIKKHIALIRKLDRLAGYYRNFERPEPDLIKTFKKLKDELVEMVYLLSHTLLFYDEEFRDISNEYLRAAERL